MRVDPYYVSNLAGSLDQTQSTEQQLTSELSSGAGVTSLGQNPVAAGENVLLLNQMQRDDSFTQSSSLVQGQLQVADSAMGSVVTQLTEAIAIATGANNGTLNTSQLQAISNQLSGIRDEVTSLANTSYQGQYIFGGGQTSSPPFTNSNGSTPAMTTYNGDETVNSLQTPNGQTIQLNMPGDMCMTPLVRLLVVFHFLRQALGTQTAPSNPTLLGLGLMMTWFLMTPVLNQVDQQAVEPYRAGADLPVGRPSTRARNR